MRSGEVGWLARAAARSRCWTCLPSCCWAGLWSWCLTSAGQLPGWVAAAGKTPVWKQEGSVRTHLPLILQPQEKRCCLAGAQQGPVWSLYEEKEGERQQRGCPCWSTKTGSLGHSSCGVGRRSRHNLSWLSCSGRLRLREVRVKKRLICQNSILLISTGFLIHCRTERTHSLLGITLNQLN